jgi:multiple sugar transport system ATP-binding protein
MVAGLEEITEGTIRIGDRAVNDIPPKDRDIAMVFQSYALYPHMNVADNMGFALKMQGQVKAGIRELVGGAADRLGIGDLLARRPRALSGGQRQRVALGRAIVREPQAFLMDEPLSNLDAKLRVGMRTSLAQLHARLGVTTVYVTHDQVEAMTLGQRVAVMRDGRILQVDHPQHLYEEPRNLFVAAFIGSPAMNLVEAAIDGDEVVFGGFRATLDARRRPPRGSERIVLGIRPEAFEDAEFASNELPRLDVVVEVVEELGSDAHVVFAVDAPHISAEVLETDAEEAALLADAKSMFTARVDPRTRARVGGRISLALDPSRFYFFEPQTGESLLEPLQPSAGDAEGSPLVLANNPTEAV